MSQIITVADVFIVSVGNGDGWKSGLTLVASFICKKNILDDCVVVVRVCVWGGEEWQGGWKKTVMTSVVSRFHKHAPPTRDANPGPHNLTTVSVVPGVFTLCWAACVILSTTTVIYTGEARTRPDTILTVVVLQVSCGHQDKMENSRTCILL